MNYHNPIHLEQFPIYDIFHNDNDTMIIITPYTKTPLSLSLLSDNIKTSFNIASCPHNHTIIYTLKMNYEKQVTLCVNDSMIETSVNKYPSFKDEIIVSTIVKDEDDFILPWIKYHISIGVSRFIIYDNSSHETLSVLLEDYIAKKYVTLIRWNYPYYTSIAGLSGQTTQQNHSIYAFQNSAYIGLFDIDEYINLQDRSSLRQLFEELIVQQKLDTNQMSCFRFLNKFFYNPDNSPIQEGKFLKISNCDEITRCGREKCFVLPKHVSTFSVHMVTSGKPMYTIDSTNAYFNHYFYLNKKDRGRNRTSLVDNTIQKNIPDDMYKDSILFSVAQETPGCASSQCLPRNNLF